MTVERRGDGLLLHVLVAGAPPPRTRSLVATGPEPLAPRACRTRACAASPIERWLAARDAATRAWCSGLADSAATEPIRCAAALVRELRHRACAGAGARRRHLSGTPRGRRSSPSDLADRARAGPRRAHRARRRERTLEVDGRDRHSPAIAAAARVVDRRPLPAGARAPLRPDHRRRRRRPLAGLRRRRPAAAGPRCRRARPPRPRAGRPRSPQSRAFGSQARRPRVLAVDLSGRRLPRPRPRPRRAGLRRSRRARGSRWSITPPRAGRRGGPGVLVARAAATYGIAAPPGRRSRPTSTPPRASSPRSRPRRRRGPAASGPRSCPAEAGWLGPWRRG